MLFDFQIEQSREKFSALLSGKLLKEKDHVNSLPEKAILFSFQLKQAVVFLFKAMFSMRKGIDTDGKTDCLQLIAGLGQLSRHSFIQVSKFEEELDYNSVISVH